MTLKYKYKKNGKKYKKEPIRQLKQYTHLVADTGEIEEIKKYNPLDATTNPSFFLNAVQLEEYQILIKNAIAYAQQHHGELKENILDKLSVNFGIEILKQIDGFVSTELDARLSFDTKACVAKTYKLIDLYAEQGIDARKRVLFKIASTWEGLQAMKILQEDGINCNMTLLFSMWQAATAAEWGAYLISPFVGRITDWYKKANGWSDLPAINEDPGILSVKIIYNYYKTFGYKTLIMGASFRSKSQVLALSGIDKLTVSPKLLSEMKLSNDQIVKQLIPTKVSYKGAKLKIIEKYFRWGMNEEPAAIENLSNGIRKFAADTVKLEKIIVTFLEY